MTSQFGRKKSQEVHELDLFRFEQRLTSIFVSYRRADSADEASRLLDLFAKRWGHSVVYLDTESNRLGEDYKVQIGQALETASVVVALIGPSWTKVQDAEGRRRLTAPDDWVREELTYAIRNRIALIPVFVRDAPIPDRVDLPTELATLPDFHGKRIQQQHFDSDATDLAVQIEYLVMNRFLSNTRWRVVSWIIRKRRAVFFLVAFCGAIFWYLKLQA